MPKPYPKEFCDEVVAVHRDGGTVRCAGTNPTNIIGDGESPWWEAILVVESPPSQAFSEIVTNTAT